MRLGQPDVQRNQPGLGAEAEERESEGGDGPPWRQMRLAHGVEGEPPAAPLHDSEAQQDGDRADVRDEQVKKAGAPDLGNPVLRDHEEIGRQRHRLPGHHEAVRIVREDARTPWRPGTGGIGSPRSPGGVPSSRRK